MTSPAERPTADMSLLDFVILFYLKCGHGPAKRMPGPQALMRYRRIVKAVSHALGREALVSDLSRATLKAFDAHCKGERLLAPETIRWERGIFEAIWRHAAEDWELVPIDEQHRRRPCMIWNRGPDGKPYPVSCEPGTLWAICLTEYFPKNLRIRTEATKKQYRCAIRDFTEFLGHAPTLADLQDDNLIGMMRQMLEKGLSAKTVNERRGRINSLWTWLAKRRRVEEFPTVDSLPEPKRIPKALTKDELTRLLEACRHVPGRLPDSDRQHAGPWASDWWVALHLVLWDSGERISAVMACRWEWLDLQTGQLDIPAEARKARERDMTYTLHKETLEALRRIRVPGEPRIFAWAYRNMHRVYLVYRRIRQDAGLPVGHRFGFHQIRRSVASHIQAAGHDASNVLQHSSPAVTRESYLDPAICSTTKPSEVLFRIPESAPDLSALAWL